MMRPDQTKFIGLIERAADHEGRRTFDAFSDFLQLSFHAIAGPTLFGAAREKNEAEYMAAIGRYRRAQKAALDCYAEALAVVVEALEDGAGDFLGPIFSEVAGNAHAGQFFTPIDVSRMMAIMTTGDDHVAIAEHGVLTVMEPAVGCGAMVIAMAEELKRRGVAVHSRVHFTMVDIDLKCVHAAYIQCSLLGLNATVLHGDSLRAETWGGWRTFAAMTFPIWQRRSAEISPESVAPLMMLPAPDDPKPAVILPGRKQLTLFD